MAAFCLNAPRSEFVKDYRQGNDKSLIHKGNDKNVIGKVTIPWFPPDKNVIGKLTIPWFPPGLWKRCHLI